MDPIIAPKKVFMFNHSNYYYNIKPFGLNNVVATYKRLMNVVFLKKTGHNLEIYIDEMNVKTSEWESHAAGLKDIIGLVKRYNMSMNPQSVHLVYK